MYEVPLMENENSTIQDVSDISNDESDEEFISKLSLIEELRLWALTHKISLSALSDLLKVLQSHGKAELPADSRTLLKTPTELKIVEIGKGKFWYNGIEKCLTDICFNQQIPEKLSLIFNIDGMSPFNSSNLQFWPIHFLIHELRDQIYPLVAAAYYGENKPPLPCMLVKILNLSVFYPKL